MAMVVGAEACQLSWLLEWWPVRIYFHLKDAHEVLPDDQGVEVAGPQQARAQALEVINELRQKDACYWSGWTLVAVDDAGDRLFSLNLANPV